MYGAHAVSEQGLAEQIMQRLPAGAALMADRNFAVFSVAAWNEIAAAKTLSKVRELQGNNPQVGTPGVISADTPTNIYFFIASWRPD